MPIWATTVRSRCGARTRACRVETLLDASDATTPIRDSHPSRDREGAVASKNEIAG